jgi:hypothetical protein
MVPGNSHDKSFRLALRSDWYAYVFVGSISAVASIEDDEKEIQIVPEEIFHGKPANPLIVKTSQAACLPKLAAGERWLFFLVKRRVSPLFSITTAMTAVLLPMHRRRSTHSAV